MKSNFNRLLPVLFAGMIVYAGCAKQELVKKDEPLTQTYDSATSKLTTTSPEKTVTATVASSTEKKPLKQAGPNDDIRKALESIYFDFDSSALNDPARTTLVRNFEILKQNPLFKILIEGNCDERGSDEYNLALGERRAQAAVRYLSAMGISAERLSSISYGEEKPADNGHDKAAWAKNRRDEFTISK